MEGFFNKNSDLQKEKDLAKEILDDLNNAIKSLNRLSVGAMESRESIELSGTSGELIDNLLSDVPKMSEKLEVVRSILFGQHINWDIFSGELGKCDGYEWFSVEEKLPFDCKVGEKSVHVYFVPVNKEQVIDGEFISHQGKCYFYDVHANSGAGQEYSISEVERWRRNFTWFPW